jgi:RNA polymerase sigma factor (sigma-70 family)
MTKARDLVPVKPLSPEQQAEHDRKKAEQAERDRVTPELLRLIRAGATATGRSKKANAARQRGQDAAAELIDVHSMLIYRHVSHYRRQNVRTVVEAQDLFWAGAFALVKAAERFDPDRGTAFGGYASTAIRRTIERELTETAHLVRVKSDGKKVGALNKAMAEVEHLHPKDAVDYSELAELSGLTVEEARWWSTLRYRTANMGSIEAGPRRQEDSSTSELAAGLHEAPAVPLEMVTVQEAFAQPGQHLEDDPMHDPEFLGTLLDLLEDDEREVIELRWLQGMTQDATRIELHRRAEKVRELEASALHKLQEAGPEQLRRLLAA